MKLMNDVIGLHVEFQRFGNLLGHIVDVEAPLQPLGHANKGVQDVQARDFDIKRLFQ